MRKATADFRKSIKSKEIVEAGTSCSPNDALSVSVLLNVPGLDLLSNGKITEDDAEEGKTVAPGRRNEPEVFPKGRQSNHESRRDNKNRHADQERTRPALKKRNLGRTNHVDDEGLRAERLQKPARLELLMRGPENEDEKTEG